MSDKPLAGVRVLDLSRLLPGPYCSQLLAQLGAEVVRVEDATRPDGGDMMRASAPGSNRPSRFFDLVNGGKRSVGVDLNHEAGRTYLLRLIRTADVLIEGFRPGVMTRFGLDYESVQAQCPRLVYCSISGFGQSGPLAQAPSHDINYQSLTGVLGQTAAAGHAPVISSFQAGDLAGGSMMALSLILAALYRAQRTSKGQFIDVSMTHSLGVLQPMLAFECLDFGEALPAGAGMVNGGIAAYNVYETADQKFMAVGALEPKFWSDFCDRVQRPDLLRIGHLTGERGRDAIATVGTVMRSRTQAEWEALFPLAACCVTPVLTPAEALQRGFLSVRIDPRDLLRDGPALGESTIQMGLEVGIDDQTLQRWIEQGAIR